MKLIKQLLGKVCITVDKNDWSSTRAYDKLVIVSDGLSSSYISRKPVPRGISLSNTEYWKLLASAKDIATEVTELVNQIRADVDALSVVDIDGDEIPLDEVINDLVSVTQELTHDVEAIKQQVNTEEVTIEYGYTSQEVGTAGQEFLSTLVTKKYRCKYRITFNHDGRIFFKIPESIATLDYQTTLNTDATPTLMVQTALKLNGIPIPVTYINLSGTWLISSTTIYPKNTVIEVEI